MTKDEEIRLSLVALGTNWGIIYGALYRSLIQGGLPEDGAIAIISQVLKEYVVKLMLPTQQTKQDSSALIEHFLKMTREEKPQ